MRKLFLMLAVIVLWTVPVRAEDYIHEDDVYQMCEAISAEHGGIVSPEWLQAVAWKESRYNADAENGSCKGLCQINPYVWKGLIEEYGGDVMDPYTNLSICCRILTQLYDMSPEDPYWVMMHYNMNQKSAEKLYAAGAYTKYAVSVMDKTAELEEKHGKWVFLRVDK